MENAKPEELQCGEAHDNRPGKLEPQPVDKTEPYDEKTSELGPDDMSPPTAEERGPCDPPAEGPVPHNGIKRADLPWQVVQLSESLPNDVNLVAYFMIGADHVLVTDKGHYGLHEGSLSRLKMHVLY